MSRLAAAVAITVFLSSSPHLFAQTASASIQVSVSQPQPVAAGANFDYVINVSNEGPSNAANMTLTFPLPSGVSFQSEIVPAGWTCNVIAPGTIGATVTCTTPTLAPGTAMFTVTAATPPSAAPGTYSTTATISSTTPDPKTNDNSAQVDVIISTQSDFKMSLSASPNPVSAGANLTYTMGVTNQGPSTGTSATASLPLPASTTFVSIAAPAGWSCITPAVGANGTVSCSLTSSLAPGSSATFTIVAKVASSVASGSTIAATATVSSPDDPVPANDTASASVLTNVLADVGVTKTLAPATKVPGGSLQYTIIVTDNGPSDATAVSMTDTLPAQLRFTSLSSPGGWSCTTPPSGGSGLITCSVSSMTAGSVATFTLNVVIDPATAPGTSVANTAQVSASSPDTNGANNTSTSTFVVASPPNLNASKSVSGGVYPEGSTVTYTIVVTNSGSIAQGDNPGNELTDVLPSSLTLISATATSGTAVANVGTNTVTWNGSVAASSSVTITIQALVKTGTYGTTISNSATISFDSDANGTNDTTRSSDDPSTAAASDPTSFVVTSSIPTLSVSMLMLLAAALAAVSLMWMKK